jgi:serine/threonine-protein phosphatase 2A regulatory subunit B''
MAITLNDLVKCQQGDIIISILIDAKAFYDYDQRENGGTL